MSLNQTAALPTISPRWLIGAAMVAFALLMLLMPEYAMAQANGGFLGDTTGFQNDAKRTWTIVSYVLIFAGLGIVVVGMLFPVASYLKWGAIGAILVGAFGESLVTYFYEVGGNEAGTQVTGAGSGGG